ncbi:MAG: hypothetical protein U5O16_00050 [Rhodococcus sp. (in: high G+C Gram-positive bacteria)]|uniref:hypothetical protein n=1 Tax=Rhodococcus sp. TaxID=1831 RepID=UPI002AD7F3DA|nr:hypothetical protein [Rhodococcus sp. (in: high G+C Gram-positive bacteria)]
MLVPQTLVHAQAVIATASGRCKQFDVIAQLRDHGAMVAMHELRHHTNILDLRG